MQLVNDQPVCVCMADQNYGFNEGIDNLTGGGKKY